MKRWDQLSESQRARAVEHQVEQIILVVVETNCACFPSLEKACKAAAEEAERLQTPWFFGSILYERAKDDIDLLAREDAEAALYAEPDEYIVSGIIE